MKISGINAFYGYRNLAVAKKPQRPANIRFGEEQESREQKIQELRKEVEFFTKKIQELDKLEDDAVYYLYFNRARALIGLGELSSDSKEKLQAYEDAISDLSVAKWHNDDREIKKGLEVSQEILNRKRDNLLGNSEKS